MKTIQLLSILLIALFTFSGCLFETRENEFNLTDTNDCISPTNNPNISDAVEIQEAINSALIEGKSLCLTPNKVYEIDQGILGYGISIEGNNATFQFKTDELNNFIMLQYSGGIHPTLGITIPNEHFFIKNLYMDGNRDSIEIHLNFKESYPLAIYNSNHVSIENCHFFDVPGSGIRIQDSKDILVTGSSFIDIGPCENPGQCYCEEDFEYVCPGVKCTGGSSDWDAIVILSYNETGDITINDCRFENIGKHTYEHECIYGLVDADAIHAAAGKIGNSDWGTIKNITVIDCYFENISRRCVKIMAGSYVDVIGNTAVNCGRLMTNVLEQPVDHIFVKNNKVFDSGMLLEIAGVESNVDVVRVEDNTFMDGKRAFIYCGNTSGISNGTIANNTVIGLNSQDASGANTYIWVGRGEYVSIVKNTFHYNSYGEWPYATFYPVNPFEFHIVDNRFTLLDEGVDQAVIYLNNCNQSPGHNTIQGNQFYPRKGDDNSSLFHTSFCWKDLTNKLK